MASRNRLAGRMMFLAAGLLANLPAHCQSPEFKALCEENLPSPSLEVKRLESGYSVDRHLSFRDLTDQGADLLRHGKQHVLGITRAEMAATLEIRLARLESQEEKLECLSPQITITVEYKPLTVLIGREFPPGSCSYREILGHEMRHVQAYRQYLPRVQAGIRRQLANKAGARILYGSQGSVEENLKAEAYDKWLPLVDGELRQVDAAQAKIDSPEEYDRMERVCDGEVQQYLHSVEEPRFLGPVGQSTHSD